MAYTNIDDPSAYFQTKLWTGNNGSQSITNDGNSDLQPDWIWQKQPDTATDHHLVDTSRGITKVFEMIGGQTTESIYSSFDSNGFSVSTSGDTEFNASGQRQSSLQWKCNGGTTSTNTDGDVNSTVQVNTTAGFSIVQYVGSRDSITPPTGIGHGLGQKPNFIVVKLGGYDWIWYHSSSDFVLGDERYDWDWNSTAHSTALAQFPTVPTSSVFYVGTGAQTNREGYGIVAYCFAEKQGYSKFGHYTGNGSTNGPFVYTGFKPAWVEVRQTSQATINWDTSRGAYNVVSDNQGNSNSVVGGEQIDFLSNGFKLRDTGSPTNNNGSKYIFTAFAENPFVTSTGIPTTAR